MSEILVDGSLESSESLSPLKRSLLALREMRTRLDALEQAKTEPVAIIGMGCRFPGGVDSPEAFWNLLSRGESPISELPEGRWNRDAFYDPDPQAPGKMYTTRGGYIEQVDRFDAQFWGLSPRETIAMDPQQRLLLEVSWEALENAGQAPERLVGSQTGVFIGIGSSDYAWIELMSGEFSQVDSYMGTGSLLSVAAGRIAYLLGLQGPALSVDTACSSSLVALHLACQHLRSGKIDMALVGGVNLILSPLGTIYLAKSQILSPDGRCKSFDAAADGYVRGEGCGVVVLKRLSDAVAHGDLVLAVIRGTAVNHDGRSSGLTVPNGLAQRAVIEAALADAAGSPLGPIDYVEAMGTGTSLGDSIELRAVADVYGKAHSGERPLIIGSVKTNIGHLEAASGIASLIKTILSIQHGLIPPHLHFHTPTPLFDWEENALLVPTRLMPWPDTDGHRAAGVSSFGLSGTNAHVIVESPPAVPVQTGEVERPLHLLTLSAHDANALKDLADRYQKFLEANNSLSLGDTAYSANTGRSRFTQRVAVLAASIQALQQKLKAIAAGQETTGVLQGQAPISGKPKIALLFTGKEVHYPGAGRQLYDTQLVFRRAVDQCAELVDSHLERPLLSALYPVAHGQSLLVDPAYGQPALFVLEYALAKLWQSWGVMPSILLGHDVGEYVAACVAGVFGLEDALALITARGRLVSLLQRPDVVATAKATLIDTCLEQFKQTAARVHYFAPKIRIVSSRTGQLVPGSDLSTPAYWSAPPQIGQPAQFAAAIQALQQSGANIFLEVAPRPALIGNTQEILPSNNSLWLASLSDRQSDWEEMLESLGKLYLHGVDVDWEGFERDYPRKRIALPTYPFQRQRYWFSAPQRAAGGNGWAGLAGPPIHPLLGRHDSSAGKEVHYNSQLGSHLPSYLADRRVYGRCLVPESVYVEISLAAAVDHLQTRTPEVENLVIHSRLELHEGTLFNLQTILTPEGPSRALVRIYAREAGSESSESSYELLAESHITSGAQEPTANQLQLDEVLPRAERGSPATWLDELKRVGIGFEQRFRCVSELWFSEEQVRAKLDTPIETNAYSLHPILLDTATQLLSRGKQGDVFLPVGLERLRIYDSSEPPVWCRAVRVSAGENWVLGNLFFYGNQGQLLIEATGLRLEAASPEILQRDEASVSKWFYGITWQPQPRTKELINRPPTRPGSWIIFADKSGVGASLAERMEAMGDCCLLVYPEAERPEPPVNGKRTIPVFDSQAYTALLNDAMVHPLKGVIHLWNLDAPNASELCAAALDASQNLILGSVLYMLQSLITFVADRKEMLASETPRLWLITRGAQPVVTGSGIALAQAAAWGFGKAIALEHPKMWGGLIDLDPEGSSEETDSLVNEIRWPDGEDQVAYRQGARYAARLSSQEPELHQRHRAHFRLDSAYLINTELGGMGLHVARWMAEEGVRRIILLSRTPLPPRRTWNQLPADSRVARHITAIRSIEALGATVYPAAVDVSDETQLEAFLEAYAEQVAAPIRGVIHDAGFIQDQSLLLMSLEELQAGIRSKVLGGWLLHQKLSGPALDFFVSISSNASVGGSIGQANDAAANAFLDVLTYYRRAQGQPGISINWGSWSNTSAASGVDSDKRHAQIGITDFNHRQLLKILNGLLFQDLPQVWVIPAQPEQLQALFASAGPFWGCLKQKGADAGQTQFPIQDIAQHILRLEAEERAARTLAYLKDHIGRILRLEPERVPTDHSVVEVGFDSIMVMELARDLDRDLKLSLYPREIFEQPSIELLAAHILEVLERRISALPTEGQEGQTPDGEVRPIFSSVRPPVQGPVNHGSTQIEFLPRQGKIPISYTQQRLWFLDQLEPGSSAYNIPLVLRLQGTLVVPALEHSLSEIIRRHETLRTTFLSDQGYPVQVIAAPQPLRLTVIELQFGSSADREKEARRLADEEALLPFNLEKGPLFRTKLIKLSETEHLLTFTLHHIVSDGWSMGVLVRELEALYNAFVAGRASPLSELPIQYADFAAWQRKWLQGEILEKQLIYWQERLAGALPAIDLPGDFPRPAVQSYRGASISLTLPETLRQALVAFSRTQDATLYMTLLAAFNCLLYRLSGQDDLCVGIPVAGRTRPQTEGLIGFFINTLVLRTVVDGNGSFPALLSQVRQATLEAYDHQDLPFEKLVEVLHPERDMSRTPLFQVMFNMLHLELDDINMTGLGVTPLPPPDPESKFDLTLYVHEKHEGIHLSLVYNTDLFSAARMAEMLDQYQLLLTDICANPDRRILDHSLVTPGSQPVLPDPLQELNAVWEGSILDHFAESVRRYHDGVALVDNQGAWTYRQLDLLSSKLGHYLLGQGIRPQELVAVYAHRSASLVCALLGILKAGAAFVILDPAYPALRLISALRLAQPRALLRIEAAGPLPEELEAYIADSRCRGGLVLPGQTTEMLEVLQEYSDEVPCVQVDPDDLAYVAFTSGSMGKPKGILGTHRPLAHFFQWHCQQFGLQPSDRFSMLSGLSHDPLLRDIFTPLWLGASLYIPDTDMILSPGELASWMRKYAITVTHITPPLGRTLLETNAQVGEGEDLPNLRYAFFGGDILPRRLLRDLRRLAPAATWVNFYGATETPQAMAFHVVSDAGANAKEVVPLGNGIDGVQLLVLNAAQRLAGVGELGEIYIRTPYLAQGYLDDERLTRERFLPNPYSQVEHDRLYRSGDLGRYLPSGQVEFVGRSDNQVNIRGFRMELSEVEASLHLHPAVQQTALKVWDDPNGNKRLVAYFVPAQGQTVKVEELRSHLKALLPDYMLPSAFIALDALPLSPNGKINYASLPEPDLRRPDIGAAYVPPQTPLEELIAGIWAEVLSLDQIGLHDNFFDLGGHSLLATLVTSRIRKATRMELSLRHFFEVPTVAGLAQAVEAARHAESFDLAAPIPLAPRGVPLPLSFAQQRVWFLQKLAPDSAAYNLVAAIRILGALDYAALEMSLNAVVGRHESLRTTFSVRGGRPVQFITEADQIELSIIDLAALPRIDRLDEAIRLAQKESEKPLDLEGGRLFQVTLYRLDAADHLFCLQMHHVNSDQWSMQILGRDILAFYQAYRTGGPVNLPDLPLQYADYAFWQRSETSERMLEPQLAFWKRQLEDLPVLELPADFSRPAIQSYSGARHYFQFSPALMETLQRLGRQEEGTLFMTLLAGFDILLARYSGLRDIAIGTPVSNRSQLETENLIGNFTNTLVLRTDLSGNPTFRELLSRVRETTLNAFAHQDLPFERLVEELQPEREMSRPPLVQVLFNLQNAPLRLPEYEGLSFHPIPIDRGISQFDLSLYINQESGYSAFLEYNTDVFALSTIQRMADHLNILLEAIAANPDQAISDLPLLSHAERELLLTKWNATEMAYPRHRCIHHLFEEQVERSIDAPAVIFGDQVLTYTQLNERANCLADYLSKLGVGPDTLVGIYAERSIEMVVGLLGVLKAGGAYLPLDPSFPKERLAFMLEDSQTRIVLTQQHLFSSGLITEGVDVVFLDDLTSLASCNSSNPVNASMPENLAYLLYTSGSTGRPKGVQVTHQNVVNFLSSMATEPGLTDQDVLLSVTSLSFDISVLEIFLPLITGARLVLVDQATAADGERLIQILVEAGITVMQATPTTWRMLAELNWQGKQDLRVLCGGEALPRELANHLLDRCASVWNMYGPTETTVWSATQRVKPGDGPVPIGRPIGNTQLYILDESYKPVPIGVPGELYIGGDGLARGYLNRPELTAERFVQVTINGLPERRLYRTGDLARYLKDGTIEFLGRLDHQVKLRGYRIELGEIETLLAQHPALRQAVVIIREDEPGNKQLVAYLLLNDGSTQPQAEELRGFLRQKLPEYMLPAAFVFLDAYPLTPNRKINRKQLPAPKTSNSDRQANFVAPITQTQKKLAEIWAEVLHVEPVGLHDNFFNLGGHSLLIVQVISKVEDIFQVRLPFRSMFDAPILKDFASEVEKQQNSNKTDDTHSLDEKLRFLLG